LECCTYSVFIVVLHFVDRFVVLVIHQRARPSFGDARGLLLSAQGPARDWLPSKTAWERASYKQSIYTEPCKLHYDGWIHFVLRLFLQRDVVIVQPCYDTRWFLWGLICYEENAQLLVHNFSKIISLHSFKYILTTCCLKPVDG